MTFCTLNPSLVACMKMRDIYMETIWGFIVNLICAKGEYLSRTVVVFLFENLCPVGICLSGFLDALNFSMGTYLFVVLWDFASLFCAEARGFNLERTLQVIELQEGFEEIRVNDKVYFIEEPVEIMDRQIKKLKRSRIPIVKVRWDSRRGAEFTWEREDQFKAKYPHLFALVHQSSPVEL
ncbi:hypothetical protein Tco_0308361 [Tanacetum coccineum]